MVLGLPGFLLPGGVHLKAIFVIQSCSILSTRPSYQTGPATSFLVEFVVGDFVWPKDLAYGTNKWALINEVAEMYYDLNIMPALVS